MSIAAYEELAQLAEAELTLCEAGRFEELDALYERGTAIVAGLPETPPAAACEPLERAARAQAAVAEQLETGLAEARAELSRLRRGRDAARAYGASAT